MLIELRANNRWVFVVSCRVQEPRNGFSRKNRRTSKQIKQASETEKTTSNQTKTGKNNSNNINAN